MRRPPRRAWVLTALAATACGPPEPVAEEAPQAPSEVETPGNFRGRIYERNFVFTTVSGDTTFLVPWILTSATRPGGVDRHARGFLARGETWEAFFDRSWSTPPSRAPWRVLPHEELRLVVGDGDAVEGILFGDGVRELELELGEGLVEWAGEQGHVFRLLDGAAYVADRRVAGMILDMSRVLRADEAPAGDWAFLTSGDSLQVVLEGAAQAVPGTAAGYRGWARLDFRDLQWPTLALEWTDVRAFPPARQDVPVSWAVRSSSDEMTGTLEVQSAQIQAGEGAGPLLPVDALFVVTGTLTIEGGEYPVRGLFRHTRS